MLAGEKDDAKASTSRGMPAKVDTKESLKAKADKIKPKKHKEAANAKAKKKSKSSTGKKSKDNKSSSEGGGLPRSDLNWKTKDQKANDDAKALMAANARNKKAEKAEKNSSPKKGSKKQQGGGDGQLTREDEKNEAQKDATGAAANENAEDKEDQLNEKKKTKKAEGLRGLKVKDNSRTPTINDPPKSKVVKSYEALLKANKLKNGDNYQIHEKQVIKKKEKSVESNDAFKQMNNRMSRSSKNRGKKGCADNCAERQDKDMPKDGAKDMTPKKGIMQKSRYVKSTPGPGSFKATKANKGSKPPKIIRKDPPKFKSSKIKPCPHSALGLEHDVEDFLLD